MCYIIYDRCGINMKNFFKSIMSFYGFNLLYGFPIFIISFIMLGFIFSLLIGVVSLFIGGADESTMQVAGWLAIIISLPVSIILTIILSIISTKKIVFRKVREDGTKEKIPVILKVCIVISALILLIILLVSGFAFWNAIQYQENNIEIDEEYNVEDYIETDTTYYN